MKAPKKERAPQEQTFDIDQLAKENAMGISYVFIKGVKREEKLPDNYKITKRELMKLIKKYYGGK